MSHVCRRVQFTAEKIKAAKINNVLAMARNKAFSVLAAPVPFTGVQSRTHLTQTQLRMETISHRFYSHFLKKAALPWADPSGTRRQRSALCRGAPPILIWALPGF